MWRLCSLLLIAACSHGGYDHSPRLTDAGVKVVAVVWPSVHTVPLTPEAWRASPWSHATDVVAPQRVVIAVDRTACVIEDGDVREPRATETWRCKGAWLRPRLGR